MPGNDEAANSKPPLSLDDAERLASQFTPLWEDVPEAAPAAPAEPVAAAPAAPAEPAAVAPASEPTPAMVAIAAPMGSSPDIDPNSTELPVRRSDYAPPRPLAMSNRTMMGLAPPPAVEVSLPPPPPSATTTPLGLAGPPASKPALHVVAETSALGMEAAPKDDDRDRFRNATRVALAARTMDPDFDIPVPRKRKTGLVTGIVAVAAVLVVAVVVRTVFFKSDDATTHLESSQSREPARATGTVDTERTALAPAPSAKGAEEGRNGVSPTAAAAATDEPAAAAATGENAAPAAAPTAGVRLAALPEQTPSKPVEASKTRTPQRVAEEAKRPARPAHVATPPHHVHTEASHSSVSPQVQGGGAIVRQTPF
ncbi:MAG TPA: hypothetical protein VH062_16055 [Polyangiaceae bacterium]|jgi:hypothetical protein|nr:hypothetical protein [Polyangiaceae bacterium]